MDVIASTAFGMDMDTQSTLDHPFIQHAGTFFGIPRNPTWWKKIQQTASILAACKIKLKVQVTKSLFPVILIAKP